MTRNLPTNYRLSIILERFGFIIDLLSKKPVFIMRERVPNCLKYLLWATKDCYRRIICTWRLLYGHTQGFQNCPKFCIKNFLIFPEKHTYLFPLVELFVFLVDGNPTAIIIQLDPSVHIISPAWYLLASFNTWFLQSIITFLWKIAPGLIVSTGSTSSAVSIEWLIVIYQASHCPYKMGQAF